jgi:hypothetical protein
MGNFLRRASRRAAVGQSRYRAWHDSPGGGRHALQEIAAHVVNAGTRGAQYGEAFEIVKAVRELRAAQSQDSVFRQELVELRLAWKAKRNFMTLLATFD